MMEARNAETDVATVPGSAVEPVLAPALPQPELLAERSAILNAYKLLVKDCLEFTSKEERKLIRQAFEYSMQAHGQARRKSGEPYIFHPINVARILVKDIGLTDTTAIICALLHDVVEDTFAELSDIEREFGATVARIIDGLTKISGVFDPSTSKQAENFRKMLLTMSDDIRVALIKLADRLHNMRTLSHVRRETQLKIASETKYLYAPLAHRLGLYTIRAELEDLALSYMEPEVYNRIARKLRESKYQRSKYIQSFIKPISQRMEAIGLKCEIKGRVKSISSIYDKMKRQNVAFEDVYDIFAIRIIIESKPEEEKWDCWRAYSAITSTYRPHPERTRDWISIPKSSGYESLHVTVMGPAGRWIELQIRTARMDYMAEKGLAAHWKYKDKDSTSDQALEYWLTKIREIIENKGLSALDLVSEFKSNLVSEEIYVFTPKGDLKIMPAGSTALDFAYEIHTNLGHTCIGAKVNHQVVPLSYVLHNGDQVEVITSKKQTPKPEWLDFVITSRAISKIKEAMKEQRRVLAAKGKEIFEWKLSHLGIHEGHPVVKELMALLKVPSLQEFFYRLASHKIDIKRVIEFIHSKQQQLSAQQAEPEETLDTKSARFDNFLQEKLGRNPDELMIGGNFSAADIHIGECCHPIPGDQIVGITDEYTESGSITLHRTNCPRAIRLMSSFGSRIVKAKWNEENDIEFLSGFKIIGQDKMGMINSIIKAVSLQMKLNIRSFTIDSEDGMFEGTIKVYIHGTEEAERVIEQLKKVAGVFSVNRLQA